MCLYEDSTCESVGMLDCVWEGVGMCSSVQVQVKIFVATWSTENLSGHLRIYQRTLSQQCFTAIYNKSKVKSSLSHGPSELCLRVPFKKGAWHRPLSILFHPNS